MPTEPDLPHVAGDRKDLSLSAQFDETTVNPPDSAATPRFGPPLHAGEVGVFGPFRLFRELGHGGMGAVYAALHTRLERRLALKVMLPKYAADTAARERFLREARAAAQISHDNVVTVYDAGVLDDIPYISMQFLEGYSLDEYLIKKGNPSLSQVLRIGRETAAGLAAAHAIGLVHRDIKPANLWLETPHGRVKVLDFGLAKPVDTQVELTQSGMIVGTPAYMSPEQARGMALDARTDLFSLGVLLYRLCSGRLPFHGENTFAVLTALAVDEPAPLRGHNPSVPEALAALVHQLLAKNPAQRPASAAEVARRLQAIAEGAAAPVVVTGVAVGIPVARPVAAAMSSPMVISSARNANPFAGLDPVPFQLKPTDSASRRRKMISRIVVAGVIGMFAMMLAGIAVVVKKQGGTETKSAEAVGAKGEDAKGDKVLDPPLVKPPIIPFPDLEPGELPKVEPGSALLPSALVLHPAPLKGLRRWTIDTQQPRTNYEWMAYSPDGHWIAGAFSDGTIRLFDPKTRETRRIFATGRHKVPWLTWSADSSHLIALGWDHLADAEGTVDLRSAEASIVVVNVMTGKLVRTFAMGPRAVVWHADLSADQRSVAVSVESPDFRALLLLDLKTGKEVHRWKGESGSVSFSPEGKMLAAGWGDNLRVFDVKSGDEIVSEKVGFRINRVVWSPDARFLALSEEYGELRIWDIAGKKIAHDFGAKVNTLTGGGGWGRMAWSPDGKRLARFSGDKLLVTDGKAPWTVQSMIGSFDGRNVSWSPDSKSLVVAYYGSAELAPELLPVGLPSKVVPFPRTTKFIAHWGCRFPSKEAKVGLNPTWATFGLDVIQGRPIARPESVPDLINWAPDGKRFAFGQQSGPVVVRDYPGNNEICRFDADEENRRGFWSEDGRYFLTTGSAKTARVIVWDAATGLSVGQLDRPKDAGNIDDARLLRDGQRLIWCCGYDDAAQLECWDLKNQKQIWSVRGTSGYAAIGALSPDETALAVPAYYRITLYSTKDGKRLWHHVVHGERKVMWTPSGKQLVIGTERGTIVVLDAADGKELSMAQVTAMDLDSLGWIEPGKTLYAASNTSTAYAIDFATLRRVGGAVLFDSKKRLCIVGPDGHFRGPAGGDGNADEELLYVAEFDDGRQETFTPKQFAEKFGWKNDPSKAVLNWAAKD